MNLLASLIASTLAIVDGRAITDEEFRQEAAALGSDVDAILETPALRRAFLERLVETRLIAARARTKGLDQSAEFKAKLAAAEQVILTAMFEDAYVRENAGATQVRARFDRDPQAFSPKKVKARHILLRDEKAAANILAEALKPGTNFSELAQRYAQGPSAKTGGDLGIFGRGQLPAELEKAAFLARTGEIVPQVVKTTFGYHVIRVEEVFGSDDVAFDDVKEDVKNRLERELRDGLLARLKSDGKVEIFAEQLEKLKN